MVVTTFMVEPEHNTLGLTDGLPADCINVLLRWSGLHPKANYFFAMETEGNFILDIFYKWIPYPFLYLLPSVVILSVYMSLITAGFALADRIRGKDRTSSASPASGIRRTGTTIWSMPSAPALPTWTRKPGGISRSGRRFPTR